MSFFGVLFKDHNHFVGIDKLLFRSPLLGCKVHLTFVMSDQFVCHAEVILTHSCARSPRRA